jgi:hypothetical protein
MSSMLAIESSSALGFRDNSLSNIMDPDLASIALPTPRMMLRPEDASRLGRPFRREEIETPRASSENTRVNGERNGPTQSPDRSPPGTEDNDPGQNGQRDGPLLSLEDTTELFKRKIADAKQDTEYALAGSEAVSDAVKPKLTLDLGHSNIARLPESVVDLIRAEVERLSLSHNQIWHIPLRFSECSHLRYLNIRSNVFREIPRGVYRLHQLEILDISRNKIRKISNDIQNLKSLRVFSIMNNRIGELPPELCEMTKLQVLKIAGNHLTLKLQKIIKSKESEVSFSEMTDHERNAAITVEIKRYLRETHPAIAPIDVEASLQVIDESSMETTPRPLKRSLSSRFPVIPSTNNADPGPDGNKSSPISAMSNPPLVPTRSHLRVASGAQLAARRPGIAPLPSANNERNRSNSESVLQATVTTRQKRMGIVRKQGTELDSIDETNKINRNSHFRGVSHGSGLKRSGALYSPGGNSSSSPSSPREQRRNRAGFIHRLSSLPEQKVEADWKNPVIEGAKGILYALYQIHPHISGLIAAAYGVNSHRTPLETVFYAAATHVDTLNADLDQVERISSGDQEAVDNIVETVRRDCHTCIMAYTHVSALLRDNVKKIVAGTDARYVRTLMLLLYGSMIEVRNAIKSFGAEVQVARLIGHKRQRSSGNTNIIDTIPEESQYTAPVQQSRTATPTRDRNVPSRQGGRLRSDTTIQHPAVTESIPALPAGPVPPPSMGPLATPTHFTGTTSNNGTLATTLSSTTSGLRSRSSSRTMMNSQLSASIASTPRSGEAFNLPASAAYNSRINPSTGLTDSQEEAIFEQIFLALTRAYDAALHTIPIAKAQFLRCLEAAEENRQPKSVYDLWSTLVYRCKTCIDVSEALQIRLVNMRLKDPNAHAIAAGSGRNDPQLWLLCKSFLMSFIELLTEMRLAKSLRLLSQELIHMLRPVQKASRDAGSLIETSPWRYLTDSATAAMPPPTVFAGTNGNQVNAINTNGYSHGANGNVNGSTISHSNYPLQSPFPPPLVPVPPLPSSASMHPPGTATKPFMNGAYVSIPHNGVAAAALNGISPVSVPLPATPLSAALGPAAQATLPIASQSTSALPTPTSTNSSFSSSALPTPTLSSNGFVHGGISGNANGSFNGMSNGNGAVPSTPASAYGDSFFKGDVFQRADSLLSMPQVGLGGFLSRR